MVKPIARPYSQYSLQGLELLGSLVHEARINKALTTTDLAARAGISRSLLQRIERGDPNCSIGAVFEVASICGVPLFNEEQRGLNASLLHQREKLTLLPKSVRSHLKEVNDNF
ncbi:helix-turn-helix transcriptional regulator [Polynucleobacter kasalickyi]|uniref:Helix-turn-helix domain-containing protein n=1 Tax=Polynucleobacter kasalickyi TaxID=1938817 RepID=A0A1W2A866_9BURK|nr:helix-turn-helix transcriptional regulator [Polynucleobacter kasalickyi]SMC56662.1 Helix-turn-helix domain-containing protein [Polynucleobacter kasalickyi]